MTAKLRKLFGGLNLTWPRLIVFAVIAGVYTGLMALLPAAKDTSFADISISFEWWILFGILIIMNSKTPLDAALKCFVFFLISQPLVYLIQVPFAADGWSLFRYYKPWFYWTLLTLPMGYIGWYMKQGKWWGLLILLPMLVFLGMHYMSFVSETLTRFPYHLLSACFCFVTMLIYPAAIFDDPKLRRIGLGIAVIILMITTAVGILEKHAFYNTTLMFSSSEEDGVAFDDKWTAALEDGAIGQVKIVYDEHFSEYRVDAEFKKTGETRLILTAPDGKTAVYKLTVGNRTYRMERIDAPGMGGS